MYGIPDDGIICLSVTSKLNVLMIDISLVLLWAWTVWRAPTFKKNRT